jgi:hypothetical protein
VLLKGARPDPRQEQTKLPIKKTEKLKFHNTGFKIEVQLLNRSFKNFLCMHIYTYVRKHNHGCMCINLSI